MFLWQVISEEHPKESADFDMDTSSTNKDSDKVKDLTGTKQIALTDITVWIDPLDATKEYSGIDCRVF